MHTLKFLRQLQWQSGDGAYMFASELQALENAVLSNAIPEHGLLLGLTLFGEAQSGRAGQVPSEFTVPPNHCWALAVQKGSLLEGRYAAGTRIAGISFFLTRQWLRVRMADDAAMQQLLRYCDQRQPNKVPLAACLRSQALRLLYNSHCGEMGRLFLAARAHDLLLGLIASHCTTAGTSLLPAPAALPRMSRARDVLEARLDAPPTLPELARLAGTSVSALRKGFKSAFGLPVAAYTRKRRLEQAHQLLERGLPVAEVARRFGYTPAANFSTAFKRQFGYPPGHLRLP